MTTGTAARATDKAGACAADTATVTLGHAAMAYLAELESLESAGIAQADATLRIILALFGADADVLVLRSAALAEWLAGAWGASAVALWNRNCETFTGLAAFCEEQGWIPAAAAAPARPTDPVAPRRVGHAPRAPGAQAAR